MLVRILDGDPAQVGEFRDRCLATKAAKARISDTAKRHLRFVRHGRAVDMADAAFDLVCGRKRALNILTEDSSRQAILSVIGRRDRLSIALDADDGFHRAKTFLRINAHLWRHAIEQRRGMDRSVAL